ncbi:MAG: GIY-YIG nuclease family protein [Sphingobacteriales bacterium]|nr:MAG: GIY-YIG nuclease family protein [Sphingobacteriales bacterium]
MWYVYIIRSEVDGTLYKGYSSDYLRRLEEHNEGLSTYTSRKRPWQLVYVESHPSKTEAIKRELMLKKQNRKYLDWLIDQPSNILRVG